jgi:hypothetical protein
MVESPYGFGMEEPMLERSDAVAKAHRHLSGYIRESDEFH